MLRVRPPNPRRPPRPDVPADLAEDGEVAAENRFPVEAGSGHRTSMISSSEDVVQLVEHVGARPVVVLGRTAIAVAIVLY